jgi:hypothetical protein
MQSPDVGGKRPVMTETALVLPAREEQCEYKYEYSIEERKTNIILLTRSIVAQ